MTRLYLLFLILVLMGCERTETLDLLVFSKTNGYRHEAIPAGLEALNTLAKAEGWTIEATEDSTVFTDENLKRFDVIIFLQTAGDILGEEGQKALRDWVEGGGGLVTIHAGTVTENNWPWFVDAVGGIFVGHPPVQQGKLIIENFDHPATSFFSDSVWIIEDEWYSFDRNPRKDVNVLISIDESSYEVDDNRWFEGAQQRMGDHPLVWSKSVGEGRVFQSALGHVPELYRDSLFVQHLRGGIYWASGKE
ncbi:MAG TPA: ThuA domain-containing protein [Marinilabiliaceae bacterium]|nr:ThuA domain-containing protein [Marinilabiliaceae bacterium]